MNVSVIIPVHNGARYLTEAIDSALRQTQPPDEIIVVDDGSTDQSSRVALDYGDQVRLVRQGNRGPADARNRGVLEAQGKVVAFLDSDDIWLPNKLAVQLNALTKSDLVFGMVEKFYSDDCPPELRHDETDPRPLQPGYLPSAFMCSAATFHQVGLLDDRLARGEFIDWIARARALGLSETMLPDLLVFRRIHANNLTRSSATPQDYLQVIRQRLQQRKPT